MTDARSADGTGLVRLVREGGIAEVRLNRPEKLNALDAEMLSALQQVFDELRAKPPRCVVMTGEGKAFVAGADIRAMQSMTPDEARGFSELGHRVMDGIAEISCPVIAMVHGFALGGGCELAMACDWIVAGDRAKFGQPEVKLGLIPGFGGTVRLPWRVGPAMALELLSSGRTIDADEAVRIGLANRVVADGALRSETWTLAAQVAAVGPAALGRCKHALHAGQHHQAALAREQELFGACFGGHEAKEGMQAFLERREPVFAKD